MPLPCIITVAITGSLPTKRDNPAVPISISEQIESTQEAFEAGAAPKVRLAATHIATLEWATLSDLQQYAIEQ